MVKSSLTSLFLVLSVAVSIESTQSASDCPLWYLPINGSSLPTSSDASCRCGSELGGVIRCERNNRVSLSILHCMTYDDESTGAVEGYCPYDHQTNTINSAFNIQPSNVSSLTEFTCGWLKRTGVLCSHCKDSLGVAVLSYNFECVKCLGNNQGWILYLVMALVPLTLFFFIVILCDIDATAPHMNSLLCIIQILLFSLNANSQTFLETGKVASKYLAIGAWTIVGFWNLDIFRYLYPSFCISQDTHIFQVISLEYLVGFYPIGLIMVAYVLIELHDRDYRAVRIPWVIIKRCLKHFKRSRNINFQPKTSIIKYFSTFLLLAYTKILFVNFNLLAYTNIHKTDGSLLNRGNYVFYNASVQYLSSDHLPYFILASVILTVFNILPLLLLLLYPTKTFHRGLACCSSIRWLPLHAFADKFQGCYKDGTSNTRDYRYIAGVYLLIRLLYHLHVVYNNKYSIFLTQIIPLLSAVIFGVFRPYKNDLYNRLDCGLFTILTFGQICLATNRYVADLPITLLYVLAAIPLMYLFLLMLYKSLALCAPNTIARLKDKLKIKLLKYNLLFLPDSETAPSSYELVDNDNDYNHSRDFRGSVQNSVRPILAPRATSRTDSSNRTTYSTCEIATN